MVLQPKEQSGSEQRPSYSEMASWKFLCRKLLNNIESPHSTDLLRTCYVPLTLLSSEDRVHEDSQCSQLDRKNEQRVEQNRTCVEGKPRI